MIFHNLRIGSILALSTSPRAGGEADQGQRSGKKNVSCGCVTFVYTLFIGLGFTFGNVKPRPLKPRKCNLGSCYSACHFSLPDRTVEWPGS